MILSKKPVALAEVKDLAKDSENKELVEYLKNFTKLTKDKAEKLKEEIRSLSNLKIKEEDIIKIADFLPKDKEEVNKIFIDTTISEDEANAILAITGKY